VIGARLAEGDGFDCSSPSIPTVMVRGCLFESRRLVQVHVSPDALYRMVRFSVSLVHCRGMLAVRLAARPAFAAEASMAPAYACVVALARTSSPAWSVCTDFLKVP
jgi:hypothetical protein